MPHAGFLIVVFFVISLQLRAQVNLIVIFFVISLQRCA